MGRAYLFIASLYASSVNKCGTNEFEKRMTYVAAYNKALRASRVDPSMSSVAKKFISEVKQKAIGQEIIRSISPGQMIIKLVNDELINILGSDTAVINIDGKKPASIMLVGLQGSGKTTSIAKLANFIKIKFNKNIL